MFQNGSIQWCLISKNDKRIYWKRSPNSKKQVGGCVYMDVVWERVHKIYYSNNSTKGKQLLIISPKNNRDFLFIIDNRDKLLMPWTNRYEEGYCKICGLVFGVPIGESWASTTSRISITTFYSLIEMGIYYHGLCDRVAKNLRG